MRTFKDINGDNHDLDEYLDCYSRVYLDTDNDILTKKITGYFLNCKASFEHDDLRIELDKKYYDALTIELKNE